MAVKPQPLNPAVRGVQHNFQLEAQHRDLADDAEKRIHALQQGRQAILQRLGKQLTASSSAADGRQLQHEVRGNIMTGGAQARPIRDEISMGMGVGMQKGMMVPLMIFR
jgi:hypothetical protein